MSRKKPPQSVTEVVCMAEEVGFEPTCPVKDNSISSRARYDHFDTSPYLSQHQYLRKRGELMGRTKKNIQLKIPEKPRKIKGFRSGSYRMATTISSQPRYDHFDNSPYFLCSPIIPHLSASRNHLFFLPRQNTNRNRGGILSKMGSFCRWISSQENSIRQFDYLPKSQ